MVERNWTLIQEYYNTHTAKETIAHFGITRGMLEYARKMRKIQPTFNRPKPTGRKFLLLDDILNNRVSITPNPLRKRILKAGLLKYQCSICLMLPVWCGVTLVLQLDHINGNNKDNRLENLRFLCPNCHSQTPTFVGRHARRKFVAT